MASFVYPDLTSACLEERHTRQEAWLGLEPDICGVALAPFTPYKALLLDLDRNAVFASSATAIDSYAIGQCLWILSLDFREGDRKARKRFFKRIRALEILPAYQGLVAYFARAFFDQRNGGGASSRPPLVDWIASIVDTFASEYSWPPEQILRTPFRQLLQLNRCMLLRDDPEKGPSQLPNPLTDQLIAAALAAVN